jgi:hypothetical protein
MVDHGAQRQAGGDGQAHASVFSDDAIDDNAPGQRVVGRATEHVAMDPVTDHQMSTPK